MGPPLAGWLAALAWAAPLAASQLAATPAPAAEPGAELRISVITMGPGDAVWERFGHNAIWVEDTLRGTSIAYNYGMFDFRQDGFVARFLMGRMLYWMKGYDAQRTIAPYIRHNRSVWVQELNLSPAQRVALRDFLQWNDTDAHRYYRYDPYRDNCSTRVRDAIDRAIGGAIKARTTGIPEPATYRSHTLRLTEPDPFIYTGLLTILGHPTDRPLSAYEETFIPMALREHLRVVTIPGSDGKPTPLVKGEQTIYQGTRAPLPDAPPSWIPRYLAAGLVLGLSALWLGWRGARRALAWVSGVWYALAGVAGAIVMALWAVTDHAATYANENALQLNLLALVAAVLVPLALVRRRGKAGAVLTLVALVAGASLVGLLLKALPGFHQDNWQLLALTVPAHLGVGAGLRLALKR